MFIERTDNNIYKKWWLGIDKTVLICVGIIITIGFFMLFSTSLYAAKKIGDDFYYIKKYLIYFFIGISSLFITSFLKAKNIKKYSFFGFGILIILLFSTIFFSPEIKGGKRWLNIMGFAIQPSEFLKPIFAIVMAIIITKIKEFHLLNDKEKRNNYLFLFAGLFGIVALPLFFQPDFGMLITFCVILGTQLTIAGMKWKYILSTVFLGIPSLIFIVYNTFPHVQGRMNKFLGIDPDNYQVDMGLKAIREAGLFTGHANNLKANIPDLHTDFVFPAMVEGYGALVAIGVISIFFWMFLHIFSRLQKKDNPFVIISVSGIISYLAFQVIINVSSTLAIVPTKGMTLPLISYGGSSFMSSCFAIGIVLSLLQDQNLRK